MSDEPTDEAPTQERRGDDRRTGEDRRKSEGGIRNLFPFSLFMNRRSGDERRSGKDRRKD